MNRSGWLPRWRAGSFAGALMVSLLAGAVSVFSFAPYALWPLQILSLAGWFFILLQPQWSLRQVGWLAWAGGTVALSINVCWLWVAMARYGDMPAALAALALLLFAAGMAVYPWLFALLGVFLQRRWRLSLTATLLLLFPALWTLSEWLRGWLLSGFPWAIGGYAHSDSPLAGYAPLVGVYGVGYVAALLAAILALLLSAGIGRARRTALVLLAVVLLASGALLRSVVWTQPSGTALSVRLLQGNIAQDIKFDPQHLQDTLDLYRSMLTATPADLIITPETALPVPISMLPPDYLSSLQNYAAAHGSAILLGVIMQDGSDRYANSVLGLSTEYAAASYRYDKHHLVPFGEFIPYGFAWFVRWLHIPMGELTPGAARQAPMRVGTQFVLPNICYESLFGEEIADKLRAQQQAGQGVASILLNVSNLAWYGDSIGIPQHLQFARMRVLETGRPWLSATNTGATVHIRADGVVQAQLPFLRRASLTASVQGQTGMTPYLRWGNRTVVWLALFMLLAARCSVPWTGKQ
ncbi:MULTISPECIES: apolipoprotein N-acyltransferase [unclassified Undibacterium]|uniref:apolipoprotein N-acyltransferase n=1 Tax=unclassified Undibacterium TaxID=2630295 RepID=UPI002AC98AFF|nr:MULTISPECIES: apolipoprotein N-acyltransferase [unclassified Undibacterium]MEB0139391.1 apolipoprotein N-acyltransferase [Undibacterium sp. CCC2.1]MEB0173344.1 apolipoprotein N-acyltransferase [Undibacterium sp. CCC1.1]MEB0177269.1 apolipoprotein N-acyltransferase [Undibacterium sp. CCC3.4]MEB0216534.1 apolipoprotein N-acyltransferase [Undibacterium sp. 5I2]WPX44038.1 apolipoprotein N-acyltransferase [Undibacterium sp. CCC3.4]